MLPDTLPSHIAFRLPTDLQRATDKYLALKGVVATEPTSPRIGCKILQEASLEDNSELSDRFARLLAEALDPKGKISLSSTSRL